MRETAVRLLGLTIIASAVALQLKFGLTLVGGRMAEVGESFEFSGPGLVELFEAVIAPNGFVWLSNFPYLIAVGLLLCFASKPISRWIAPRGGAA